MKKYLLSLLLSALVAMPVFAAKAGTMEIDGKIGVGLNPFFEMKLVNEGELAGQLETDCNAAMSIAADFFYYADSSFAAGLGIEYNFSSDLDFASSGSCGWTNIYAQVKPVIALEKNNIFNNVYFLGRLGFGFLNMEIDASPSFDEKGGLYWAVGIGTTIKENFIVELLYTENKGSIELDGMSSDQEIKITYNTIKINAGYRFEL